MKKFLFLLCIFLLGSDLYGQDPYHSDLLDSLQTNYSLPTGSWLFYDNESDIWANGGAYGGSSSVQNASGQAFAQKLQHSLTAPGNNPWDAGWNIRNTSAVQSGDVVLMVFNIRSVGGEGKVNFFVENASTFSKEVILTLPVGQDWRQYLVPFQSGSSYGANGLSCGFHFAFQAQTIEVGGFTAINYQNSASLSMMPYQVNNEFYGGWEDNAPWRAEAASRIDSFRKAELLLSIKDTNGDPVPNAGVAVKMLRHEFAFGSAITANRLPGNNDQNIIYYNKILDLDGQGHGFNWVVFENDMKWPAWEDEWFVNKSELVNAVSWLRENDIKIRGHNLIWPGSTNLPGDINNNLNDLPYIQNRINTHLNTILNYPGIAGEIEEWDVINETVTNTTLADAFAGNPGYPTGRELYADIFQQTRNEDSLTGLWLNDFVTLTLSNEAGSPAYEELKQHLGEIVNSAPIDGIGFQGHIGGFPNGIPSVLATYDDFYQAYGLKAKVTEFDLPSIVNEELAADYLVDFMTATFSHESMDGFLFWNFWDGSTWLNPAANLFRQDWSLSQPGEAFIELVFDEWWTDELVFTQNDGQASVKGFKGLYEISYVCNGQWVRDTVELSEAMNYEINCDQISTSLDKIELPPLNLYPNPATNRLVIDGPRSGSGNIRILDLQGRLVQDFGAKMLPFEASLQLPAGIYICEYRRENQLSRQKLVIQK